MPNGIHFNLNENCIISQITYAYVHCGPIYYQHRSPDGSINHAVHCYAAVRIASTLVASLVSVY